jgi:hypothetical protein
MNKKKNSSVKATKVKTPTKPKEKKVVPPALVIELVTFSVKATIPTQMYGNIMPEIVVKARTIEDAKRAVMPIIEEMYAQYMEDSRDGRPLKFINKANVTATEKIVPRGVLEKSSNTPGRATPPAPVTPEKPQTPAQASADALAEDLAKSVAYTKAENAIKNSTSADALGMIEDQIQKSVKLTADEKPMLLTDVLKKRKEFDTL